MAKTCPGACAHHCTPCPLKTERTLTPAPHFSRPNRTESHSCKLQSGHRWLFACTSQGQLDKDTCVQTPMFTQKWRVPTAQLTRGILWKKTDLSCCFYKRGGDEYVLYMKVNDSIRTLKVSIGVTPSSPNQVSTIIPWWLNFFKRLFSPLCSPQVEVRIGNLNTPQSTGQQSQ